ncbi:MAG: hypothetical protein AAB263_08220 [Planctomycetota bacterium]
MNPLLVPIKHTAPRTTYELAIADPCVLYDDSDNLWKAWYSTSIWDTSAPGTQGRIVIKYAESRDAVHWTPQEKPVLISRLNPGDWDYTQVETPSVIRNPDPRAQPDRRFLMFYSGGNRETDTAARRPDRRGTPYYSIGLAWSSDGRTFVRHHPGLEGKAGLILTAPQAFHAMAGFADGAVADPDAVIKDGRIHLYFTCYAETAARSPLGFGIGYAHTNNGWNLTLPTVNPLPSLFKTGELGGGEQPAVVYDAKLRRFDMWFRNDSVVERQRIPTDWFSTYGFWHAISDDGLIWKPNYRSLDLTRDTTAASEAYGLLTGCAVVRHHGVDHLFYGAWGTKRIPDPALYRVPLRDGLLVPGVIGFHLATRLAPTR